VTPEIQRSNRQRKSGSDRNASQETLYLLSIPGMRESIRAGIKTPANKLAKVLHW
jgi:antitoxin YefM